MTYLIIGLFLIAIGSGIILNISKEKMPFAFIAILLLAVGMICLLQQYPQAIDVYRGKTTLEITYRDSIPVDSVVVFKE